MTGRGCDSRHRSRSTPQAGRLPASLGAWSFCYAITAAVSPHTVDYQVCHLSRCASLCLCARVEGFSGPPSPDLSRVGSGVLGTFCRDARVASFTTSFVAALFTLRYRTTTLPSLSCAHKELLLCVVVGTSLSSCLSFSCSCGCLLSLLACRARFRLVVVFSVLSSSASLAPLSPFLPRPRPPLLFSLRPSPSFLPLRWPRPRRLSLRLRFGLAGSFVVVVCWRSAGLRLFLCLPVSSLL